MVKHGGTTLQIKKLNPKMGFLMAKQGLRKIWIFKKTKWVSFVRGENREGREEKEKREKKRKKKKMEEIKQAKVWNY